MSASPSPPRFRIRLDGGTELSVSTVEALALRLARGDLVPDTPVHDSSTGLWVRAADSPVVRFVLEEMWRAGDAPPPAWAPTELGSEGADAGSGSAEDPIEGEPAAAHPEADDVPADGMTGAGLSGTMLPESSLEDLFAELPPGTGTHSGRVSNHLPDIGVTLVPPSDEEAREEAEEAEDVARRIEARAVEDAKWAESRSGTDSETNGTDPPLADSEWIARSDAGALRSNPILPPSSDAGPQPHRAAPAAPPEASRRRILPWVMILGAGLAVGALILLDRTEEPATLDSLRLGVSSGATPASQSQLPTAAPIPEGLEGAVTEALGAFEREIQATVDSLSAEHGLAGAPPPPWLGGRYLSSASAYPEVRSFWEGYRRMVDDLRILDRDVFEHVLRDALDRSSDSEADVLRIESYLEARYAAMEGRREGRYRQLVAAAERAIDLHEFLVASEASLRFTPALGNTLPLDPVLEVGTDSPEVLRSLNSHLDELFRALDHSRGGGALSQSGLRSDLFLGFGVL